MKETFYFSHDYNAQHDEKIIKLMSKLGWEGYGLYWGIIERLYSSDGYLEYDCDTLAFGMRSHSEKVKSIIEDFGLFKKTNSNFFSTSVLKRIKQRKGISEANRQNALKRWKNNNDANTSRIGFASDAKSFRIKVDAKNENNKNYESQNQNEDEPKKEHTTAMPSQSDPYAIKLKEIKLKEIKLINSKQGLQQKENPNINLVMEKFYEFNPGLNFGNKTQRKATEDLIKKFSLEKLIGMVDWYKTKMSDKYCPTATTPLAFKEKIGDIKVYADKLKNNNIVNDLGNI